MGKLEILETIANERSLNHVKYIEIGKLIRESFLKDVIYEFPGVEPWEIIKALVASCSGKGEIEGVLWDAGFKVKEVQVYRKIPSQEEKEYLNYKICEALGGLMTINRFLCSVDCHGLHE
jgi:hypothetical protein